MNLDSCSINYLESLSKILAANIRRLRKQHGKISQGELAARIGMSLRAIQDIEYGESWPQAETIHLIAGVFKVEPGTLFVSSESMPKPSPEEALKIIEAALAERKLSGKSTLHPKQERLIDLILRMPVEELEHFGIDRTLTKRLRELKLIDGDLQSPDRGSKIGD